MKGMDSNAKKEENQLGFFCKPAMQHPHPIPGSFNTQQHLTERQFVMFHDTTGQLRDISFFFERSEDWKEAQCIITSAFHIRVENIS